MSNMTNRGYPNGLYLRAQFGGNDGLLGISFATTGINR